MSIERSTSLPENDPKKESVWDAARSLFIAVLLALIFRSVVYEPFHIPSGSMKGTLLVGDYIFVSKHAYGFSKHSLPFSVPLFSGRILQRVPERGDVVVFRLPSDTSISYIKRIIGFPGDAIQMRHGVLYLNGQAIPKVRVDDFVEEEEDGKTERFPQYRETLPNGRSYYVLDEKQEAPLDNTDVYIVPAGHYFMMGDNRDNSEDSRVLDKVGYIDDTLVEGRADRIFFSISTPIWEVWRWLTHFRAGRFFKAIQLCNEGAV